MSDWNLWRDRERWPFIAPGYVFLPEAALQVLAARIPGDDWESTITHQSVADIATFPFASTVFNPDGTRKGFPNRGHTWRVRQTIVRGAHNGASMLSPNSLAMPTMKQWELADAIRDHDHKFGTILMGRRKIGLDDLHGLLTLGVLVVTARDGERAAMVNIHSDVWNCERAVAWARLSQCKVRLADRSVDSWLFVQQAHLDTLLGVLRGDGANSAPAPAITSTAGAIKECADWLVAEFKKPDRAKTKRDEFKADALTVFEGRLSGRGFVAAWSRARAADPNRAKGGRRPGG